MGRTLRQIVSMSAVTQCGAEAVGRWLDAHAGWELDARGVALQRSFAFPDFASALAFVVRVGLLAERHDHHPDVELGWGRARLTWTTHDAAGITSKDLELAALSEALA